MHLGETLRLTLKENQPDVPFPSHAGGEPGEQRERGIGVRGPRGWALRASLLPVVRYRGFKTT